MNLQSRMRGRWVVAATVLAVAMANAPANASVFMPTPDLDPYAIVSVGTSASIMINSGPITGNVLVGDGSSLTTAGGGQGSITGGAFADTSVLLSDFDKLQTLPAETLVSSTVTTGAFNEAANLQLFLNGLASTQTFGALSGTTTITSTGKLNVITFSSLNNATLTLSGGPNDIFVLRTSGDVHTNRKMTLTGGLTADHVIWDLDGTTGNVFQTSGGDQLYGTFLDTMGGTFQFSQLDLTGQLINTGGHIQFVSNSDLTASPFAAPAAVPEPATWAMILIGFGALGFMLRARRKQSITRRAA